MIGKNDFLREFSNPDGRISVKKLFWLFLGTLLIAGPSFAQETYRGDVSAGISYFREGGVNEFGPSFSVAGNLNSWFGIVGDFGFYHAGPGGQSFNTFTFRGGPRFSLHRNQRVSPFAQVLLGGAHAGAGFGGSFNAFTFTGGGGVDIRVAHQIAVRPQLEYVGERSGGFTLNCARASVSVVYRFGQK
jgi:outer membrane protein with beta-barrel domain